MRRTDRPLERARHAPRRARTRPARDGYDDLLVAAHALALVVDLRLPASHSLKDKRAVVKTILEGARRRFQVAAAETGGQDKWQRAELAFATAAGSHTHADEVADAVERFVWSFPEVEVLACDRHWIEID
jgi:uncharacterized protein YlxP (DUF503 family)